MAKRGELPHFLRVTQTLALVSGLVAVPTALIEGCGGAIEGDGSSTSEGNHKGFANDYDGGPVGTRIVNDGGPVGFRADDAAIPVYDGGPMGSRAVDAGVIVVEGGADAPYDAPYDGGPVGDVVDAGQD